MKTTFLALNGKFIHPAVASYTLASHCISQGIDDINVLDLTINHSIQFVVNEIYTAAPDILAISCYIWNIDMVHRVIGIVKATMPHITIVVGGPEIDSELEGADYAVIGEGEEVMARLIRAMENGEKLPKVLTAEVKTDLNNAVFLHDVYGLDVFENKILYYETSRSCPYTCTYCCYGNDKGLRFLNMARVERELRFFIDNKVKQLKFLDRSFNAKPAHALSIWQYLIDNDNGITNFHFEVYPDLLDDTAIELLQKARAGLFQFEIGVQSTNKDTLGLIKRNTNVDRALANIKKIPRTIHVHLDLIAGLPGEGYGSFRKSFNDVYGLKPEMLQLGFLKVLKNTDLHAEVKEHGVVYSKYAPYTVLQTDAIAHDEILRLRGIERVLNLFYNRGGFVEMLDKCEVYFETAFDMYEDLAVFFEGRGLHYVSHKKYTLEGLLGEYMKRLVG